MLQWRKRVLSFVDVETTGKDPFGDRVVEIAVVRGRFVADGVEIEKRWSSLVYPCCDIPEEATSVHGITNEMIAGAPIFSSLALDLSAEIAGTVPCAYNARFDRTFLGAEWLRTMRPIGVPPWLHHNAQWLDPLPWSQAYCRYERGGHKIDTVAERLGVLDRVAGDAHRATRDAELGLWVLWALASRLHQPPEWIYEGRRRVQFMATIPHDLATALEVQDLFSSDVRARYDVLFYLKRQKEGKAPALEVDLGLDADTDRALVIEPGTEGSA